MIALFLALFSAEAATFAKLADLPALCAASEAVVRGTVIGVKAEWTRGDLVTRYDVIVDEALRGTAPEVVQVRLPGGRLDDREQRFSGVPLWTTGDQVVLFLPSADRPGGISLQGVLTVEDERIVDGLERVGTILPATFEALVAEIQQVE